MIRTGETTPEMEAAYTQFLQEGRSKRDTRQTESPGTCPVAARTLQMAMLVRGLDIGASTPDGVIGPKTRGSLQALIGSIVPSGTVDAEFRDNKLLVTCRVATEIQRIASAYTPSTGSRRGSASALPPADALPSAALAQRATTGMQIPWWVWLIVAGVAGGGAYYFARRTRTQ